MQFQCSFLSNEIGGSWFQGMGEMVQNQRPTVQISKMIGREDDFDPFGDDSLEILDRGLELNVNDYAPHRPKVPVCVFSDPDKLPRFEEFTSGGERTCFMSNTIRYF